MIVTSELSDWVRDLIEPAAIFADQYGILAFGVGIASPDGLFCEFGVYRGGSLRRIANQRSDITFHGFDTFTGFPEDGGRDGWRKGQGDEGGRLPEVPSNVVLWKGLFCYTILEFVHANPGAISFLHIDCDLYTSTKTVLNLLNERIVPGTILNFDEFWKYENWEELSEARATFEWCHEFNREIECLGIDANIPVKDTWRGERVLVRVAK
jgi:Macrocin-O-methyltransferase (TylF)